MVFFLQSHLLSVGGARLLEQTELLLQPVCREMAFGHSSSTCSTAKPRFCPLTTRQCLISNSQEQGLFWGWQKGHRGKRRVWVKRKYFVLVSKRAPMFGEG